MHVSFLLIRAKRIELDRLEETRSKLSKLMRKSTIPDVIWDDLVLDGYVTDTTDANGFSDLVVVATRRLKIWEAGVAQSQRTLSREPLRETMTERRSEVERALAFSEYLAFLADTDPKLDVSETVFSIDTF